MKTFFRILCAITWLVFIWGGGYLFDVVLPKGWQYLWYGMPLVFTTIASCALLIWWTVCLDD